MSSCNSQDKPARTVFKQYDSIVFDCTMTDDDGSIYDLTGLALTADMLSTTGNVEQMNVEIMDAATGKFAITVTQTEHAIGKYKVDVLIEFDDYRQSSRESFEFYIERAITAPRLATVGI